MLNADSMSSLYSPSTQIDGMDHDAHLRYVARRRWLVQQKQERNQLRDQRIAEGGARASSITELRPVQAFAHSLSPVYSVFRDGFLLRR